MPPAVAAGRRIPSRPVTCRGRRFRTSGRLPCSFRRSGRGQRIVSWLALLATLCAKIIDYAHVYKPVGPISAFGRQPRFPAIARCGSESHVLFETRRNDPLLQLLLQHRSPVLGLAPPPAPGETAWHLEMGPPMAALEPSTAFTHSNTLPVMSIAPNLLMHLFLAPDGSGVRLSELQFSFSKLKP